MKRIIIAIVAISGLAHASQWIARPTPISQLTPAQMQAANLGANAAKGQLPAGAKVVPFNQLSQSQQEAVRAGLAAAQAYAPKQVVPTPSAPQTPQAIAAQNNAQSARAQLEAAVKRSNQATQSLSQAARSSVGSQVPQKPLPAIAGSAIQSPLSSATPATQAAPTTGSKLLNVAKKVGSAALTAGAAVSAAGQKISAHGDYRLIDGKFQTAPTQSTAEIKAGTLGALQNFTPSGIKATVQQRQADRIGISVEELQAKNAAAKQAADQKKQQLEVQKKALADAKKQTATSKKLIAPKATAAPKPSTLTNLKNSAAAKFQAAKSKIFGTKKSN